MIITKVIIAATRPSVPRMLGMIKLNEVQQTIETSGDGFRKCRYVKREVFQ